MPELGTYIITVESHRLAPIWGYDLSLIPELCEYISTSWLLDIPGFARRKDQVQMILV